jgi:hypothetical membrane protein
MRIGILVILIIAVVSDLVVPVIIGLRYPGYNHFIDTISTLGTNKSPVQRIECGNLIVVGILLVVFSLLEHIGFKNNTWLYNMYSIGILLFGVGSILAGIFPEDPQGVNETFSGKVHGIASGIGFIFLSLDPLWAIWIEDFSPYKFQNGILFAVGLITFSLFLISNGKNKKIMKYTGLFQRLNLLALYGSLVMNYGSLV